MRIFITGVGCVGKSTIGKKLAALLCRPFFDLDLEIESYFGTSIERLQNRFLTPYSYRVEASKALMHVLSREDSQNAIIALPSSGLMGYYWRIVKKVNSPTVVLEDTPENILNRITFYNIDSRLIERTLSESEKQYYVKEIRRDISYYRPSYKRATLTVSIVGMDADEAAETVFRVLIESLPNESGAEPEACASYRTDSSVASASR